MNIKILGNIAVMVFFMSFRPVFYVRRQILRGYYPLLSNDVSIYPAYGFIENSVTQILHH